MLLLGSRLLNTPIMGLQTGTELAKTRSALINPHNLSIVAYEVYGPAQDQTPAFLRIADVREFSNIGMIIDSGDELVNLDDVIALKKLYNLNFHLINLPVIDENKHKLGKVDDYTVEINSFVIQQLNVRRPLLKSLGDSELLIHRSQIVEINDDYIVVRSSQKRSEPLQKIVHAYTNPFRNQAPQTENTTSDSF